MAAVSSTNWWNQNPTTPFGADAGFKLATGVEDFEKGDVFSVAAGTSISLPVRTTVKYTDSQHAVLEDQAGNFLNLLHINPFVHEGDVIQANEPFAKVSSLRGSQFDPKRGITYTETGDIVEFGVYDSVQRAISRENPQPQDFTGIQSSFSTVINDWKRGIFNKNESGGSAGDASTGITPTLMGMPIWLVLGGLGLVLILVLRR